MKLKTILIMQGTGLFIIGSFCFITFYIYDSLCFALLASMIFLTIVLLCVMWELYKDIRKCLEQIYKQQIKRRKDG